MLSHRDIARALLTESAADLAAARALARSGIHARSIAHCQQTVEKALKAALAVRHVVVTDRHDVSEDFRDTFPDWSSAHELAELAADLEDLGSRTEYPLFGRRDLPVWVPSEHYTEADSRQSLDKAVRVFEAVTDWLAVEHAIRLTSRVGDDEGETQHVAPEQGQQPARAGQSSNASLDSVPEGPATCQT